MYKNLATLALLISILGSCKNVDAQKSADADGDSVTAIVAQHSISLISPVELEKAMAQEDIQLVDVRTDREWESGHLKNASHFEINNTDWDSQISTLDKTKPVYVYCAKGGRSARCAKKLQKAGFTEVYDLEGGIGAWKDEGKQLQ